MAVSDLNIRLGVLYRDFDKSMKQVENRLKQSAQTLGSIGDSMSAAITLPLVGIGAVAIKEAGDFEALKMAMETTMKNAGYSTQQMTSELEALRKVALAPGIDLEQAVKGSIRLQSVGFSAERARKTLVELANAIAAAGGSAENLDSVSIQFAQMSAKGVVMASDLRVIQEAMPGVTKAMQSAFGQTTAEGIRDAGISANEFIDGITKELAKNARVQGGIKNAIDNTQSALKQFFATIGEGINEAVNLNQVADQITAKLNAVAFAFKNLDPETKKSIISFALYAASAGPIIKAFSLLYSGAGMVVSGFRFVGSALSSVTDKALGLYASFGKLSTAMKFTYAGIAIAAVTALYLAFNYLDDSVKKAMHTTIALNEIEKTANDGIAQQKIQVQSLVGVLEKETTSRVDKLEAIKRLNEISPEYFGNLKLEGDKVIGLTSSYDLYIDNLLKAARVKAAEGKLIDIDKKKIELATELARQEASRVANFQAATGGFGSSVAFEQQAINTKAQLIEQIKREISSVDSEEKAIRGVIEANLDLTPPVKAVAKANKEAADSSVKKTKATKEETESLRELQETMYLLDTMSAEQKQKNAPVNTLPTAPLPDIITSGNGNWADDFLKEFDVFTAGVEDRAPIVVSNFEKMRLAFQGLGASFQAGGASQMAIFDAVGASIAKNTDDGVVNMKTMAREAVASAIKVAKAKAIEGIFAATASALTNVPFPFNLIAAGLAAGAAGALLNGLANKISPPKLARGGLAYGPTMAMVGDNVGASVDPEVIAPLSKLTAIMGAAGGNTVIGGNFKIAGYDLVLAVEKNQKRNARTR